MSEPSNLTPEERLAQFIYDKESMKCKTLDEAVYHKSNWRRAIPEAREMLAAAYPVQSQSETPSVQADALAAAVEHYLRIADYISAPLVSNDDAKAALKSVLPALLDALKAYRALPLLPTEDELPSARQGSEKSEGRHSDHCVTTAARSSEGGIGGQKRAVESIQSREPEVGDSDSGERGSAEQNATYVDPSRSSSLPPNDLLARYEEWIKTIPVGEENKHRGASAYNWHRAALHRLRELAAETETVHWRCSVCNLENDESSSHCMQCEFSRMVTRDGQLVPRTGKHL